MITAIVAAFGLALDIKGGSLANLSLNEWGVIGLIAAMIFIIITVFREIDLAWQPRPRVIFDGFKLDTRSVHWNEHGLDVYKTWHFISIAFKNNPKNPSGEDSKAKDLIAKVIVFDEGGIEIDHWDGRWVNSEEPSSLSEALSSNRIDLPANSQQVILDIGFRFMGERDFFGWSNMRFTKHEALVPILPGSKNMEVTLTGSNIKKQTYWFNLNIPKEPESDSSRVQISPANQSNRKDS